MAMDALKNISDNEPNWQKRLSDLGGDIERRQVALAAKAPKSSTPPRESKSVKKTGSTESLRPKDDEDGEEVTPFTFTSPYETKTKAHFPPQENGAATKPTGVAAAGAAETRTPSPTSPPNLVAPASPELMTSAEIKQQSDNAVAVAQARARAQVRKRHRSQSVVSIEGNPGAYRSRSMIIVYYDEFVQKFFEELVKFVSASRNLMRKAKMAAKVAHIKRLAEMEGPAADDDDDDAAADLRIPSMRYLAARRAGGPGMPYMRAGARGGGMSGGGPADCYDELDKGLEYVQGMAEKAAHQFLREGDCADEVANIRRRLGETKVLAEKEMERILREEPDMAIPTEAPHPRMHRPPAVRRDMLKDSAAASSPARSAAGARDFKRPPRVVTTRVVDDSPMEVDPDHMAPAAQLEAEKPTVLVAEDLGPLEVDDEFRTKSPKLEAEMRPPVAMNGAA